MTTKEDLTKKRAEIERAIGKIFVEFNALEMSLTNLITVLVNPHDVDKGETIGTALGFDQKLDMAVALFRLRERPEDLRKRFDQLVKDAGAAAGKRNQIAHSELWLHPLDGRHRFRKATIRGKKGYRPQHFDWTPADLEVIAAEIQDVAWRVNEITEGLWYDGAEVTE